MLAVRSNVGKSKADYFHYAIIRTPELARS